MWKECPRFCWFFFSTFFGQTCKISEKTGDGQSKAILEDKIFTDHILPSKAKRKIKLYSSGNICHRASVEGQWLLHCEMPGWQGGSQGGLECQVGPACQHKPQSPAAVAVSSKIFQDLPIPHIGAIHPRAWRCHLKESP